MKITIIYEIAGIEYTKSSVCGYDEIEDDTESLAIELQNEILDQCIEEKLCPTN